MLNSRMATANDRSQLVSLKFMLARPVMEPSERSCLASAAPWNERISSILACTVQNRTLDRVGGLSAGRQGRCYLLCRKRNDRSPLHLARDDSRNNHGAETDAGLALIDSAPDGDEGGLLADPVFFERAIGTLVPTLH